MSRFWYISKATQSVRAAVFYYEDRNSALGQLATLAPRLAPFVFLDLIIFSSSLMFIYGLAL